MWLKVGLSTSGQNIGSDPQQRNQGFNVYETSKQSYIPV
jgi:hypothetical protein